MHAQQMKENARQIEQMKKMIEKMSHPYRRPSTLAVCIFELLSCLICYL